MFRSLALLILLSGIIAPFPARGNPAEPVVLCLGDSLTAGYGLSADKAFPARLEAALRAKGHDVRVVNAGVSGETSGGLLERLEWTLGLHPDVAAVIVETGGNDMLRGIDPALTEKNVSAVLEKLGKRNVPVLLAGMRAFSNLGPDYAAKFDGIWPRLAARHGITLYPFFLDGVALRREYLQADGLHPNAEGAEKIAQGFLPAAEALLDGAK